MSDSTRQQDEVFKVESLTMAYGDYVVMRDINFSVKRGEIVFIIGGSGCGKSTLLRHMIGLVKPASGRILYRGEDFSGSRFCANSGFSIRAARSGAV